MVASISAFGRRQHALAQHGKTDGNAGLRRESEAQIFDDGRVGAAQRRTAAGPRVFACDAYEEIGHADNARRCEGRDVETQAGKREEQQQERRREFVHPLEQTLFAAQVHITRAQCHTGQQR